ncbi:hypothetical protein ABH994_003783 [Bradyrhizobium yuanmingense]
MRQLPYPGQAATREHCGAEPGLRKPQHRGCMGSGSAAHHHSVEDARERAYGAAQRPWHETVINSLARFRILAAGSARALLHSPPSKVPRAQGRPGAGRAPTVHCAKRVLEKAAQRHTGEAKHPAFPAQWVDGLCRALPGERCTIAPVALRMADGAGPVGPQRHRKPWRTDPGRQDHTILPYADCARRVRASPAHGVIRPANRLRATLPASTTSHPAFVTIAMRPSARVGVAATCDKSEF